MSSPPLLPPIGEGGGGGGGGGIRYSLAKHDYYYIPVKAGSPYGYEVLGLSCTVSYLQWHGGNLEKLQALCESGPDNSRLHLLMISSCCYTPR